MKLRDLYKDSLHEKWWCTCLKRKNNYHKMFFPVKVEDDGICVNCGHYAVYQDISEVGYFAQEKPAKYIKAVETYSQVYALPNLGRE